MNVNEVIKYPILSEKTYAQMAEGVYTFAVDPRTNRAEVKKTVEFIFDVKVAKVNIILIPKQATKLGRSEGFTSRIKKAIITLSEGVINIFPDEAEEVKETKETKKAVKAEKKEMSEAEKKVAAKIAAKAAEKVKPASEAKVPEVKETKTVETKTTTETKEDTNK